MYGNNDPDADFVLRAWHAINDISDQLSLNQQYAHSLLLQTERLKSEAADVKTDFSLRRFNVDITRERFESELERTNAQILVENHALAQENKQLSILLKEHEQTMDTIMAKFRSHTYAADQHAHTLTRHYEHLLSAEPYVPPEPAQNPALALSLHRLAQGIRAVMMSMAGEDPAAPPPDDAHEDYEPEPEPPPPYIPLDWAHARELEIARLDAENTRLRAALGI
ncbi:hypothetical protein FA95DRAFT_1498453, partial [Auriscalpium vulgare]